LFHEIKKPEKEVLMMKYSARTASPHCRGVISFVILILFLISLSFPTAVSAVSKTEGEIKAAIDKLSKSYKNKDLKGVMAMYAKGSGTLVIGSGKGENALGYEAIKKLYEKDFTLWKMNTAMDYNIFSLSSSGRVAWLAADMSATFITQDGVIDVAGRFTAVLKKTGKNWQFVQTHFSFPADPPQVIVMDFQKLDTNKDGKLDLKELRVVIKGFTAEDFKKLDTNNDHFLSDEEFRAIWGR
jgi:ketosteroid isomerase-like protein